MDSMLASGLLTPIHPLKHGIKPSTWPTVMPQSVLVQLRYQTLCPLICEVSIC